MEPQNLSTFPLSQLVSFLGRLWDRGPFFHQELQTKEELAHELREAYVDGTWVHWNWAHSKVLEDVKDSVCES